MGVKRPIGRNCRLRCLLHCRWLCCAFATTQLPQFSLVPSQPAGIKIVAVFRAPGCPKVEVQLTAVSAFHVSVHVGRINCFNHTSYCNIAIPSFFQPSSTVGDGHYKSVPRAKQGAQRRYFVPTGETGLSRLAFCGQMPFRSNFVHRSYTAGPAQIAFLFCSFAHLLLLRSLDLIRATYRYFLLTLFFCPQNVLYHTCTTPSAISASSASPPSPRIHPRRRTRRLD